MAYSENKRKAFIFSPLSIFKAAKMTRGIPEVDIPPCGQKFIVAKIRLPRLANIRL